MQNEIHNSTPSLLTFDSSNGKLHPICHLLAVLGVHHILHFSRVRVTAFVLNSFKYKLCNALQQNSVVLILLTRWRRWWRGGEWRCGPRSGKM